MCVCVCVPDEMSLITIICLYVCTTIIIANIAHKHTRQFDDDQNDGGCDGGGGGAKQDYNDDDDDDDDDSK